MKTELEGIISGLQTYLQDVQQRSAQQTQDFTALLQEREGLQEQLQQILDENDQLRVTYEQLSLLQDVSIRTSAWCHCSQIFSAIGTSV